MEGRLLLGRAAEWRFRASDIDSVACPTCVHVDPRRATAVPSALTTYNPKCSFRISQTSPLLYISLFISAMSATPTTTTSAPLPSSTLDVLPSTGFTVDRYLAMEIGLAVAVVLVFALYLLCSLRAAKHSTAVSVADSSMAERGERKEAFEVSLAQAQTRSDVKPPMPAYEPHR
ncbi:hypothetical protein BC831DRAFT_441015 [Entophlyctis helioformis]|nr:hypothetical protein BC831DRAFT_441015 [Entophlyctis helioformis]